MGVSKNRGTPQSGWFIIENAIKIHDLGGNTTIFGNTHILLLLFCFVCWGPPVTNFRGLLLLNDQSTGSANLLVILLGSRLDPVGLVTYSRNCFFKTGLFGVNCRYQYIYIFM